MPLEGVEDVLRLTHTQAGMLFHSTARPKSGVYVAQLSCTLLGRLDTEALKFAWDGAIRRHPALRAAFVWDGLDEPLQVIHEEVEPEWTLLDWREVPERGRVEELSVRLEADRRAGFDLAEAPLMRMLLIRTGDEAHRLVWTCHHILADGWSAAILLREVLDRYTALRDGEALDLPTSTAFKRYVSWLHAQPAGPTRAFWETYLSGFQGRTSVAYGALSLQAPEDALHRVHKRWLTEGESTALSECARTLRVTLNTLVQGAWSILLHRYSGARDVVSGATVAGRPARIAGVEDAVGLFINTLPVRVRVDDAQPLRDWLRQLQEELLEVRDHEHSSLVRIQEWSDMPPGEPLFDNLLVLENTPDVATEFDVPGLRVRDFQILDSTNYPLAMVVTPGRRLELMLVHDPSTYPDEAAEQIAGHFHRILAEMPSRMDRTVGSVPLLSEAESRKVLVEWNDTGLLEPKADTVLDLIAQSVRDVPSGPAVVFGEERLTYRELHRRSDDWAGRLIDRGVQPGDRVGICMERGVNLITGMLAIMKAGGAYVPMDPEYPSERLDYVARDSGMRLLLTTTSLAETFSVEVETLCADSLHESPGGEVLPAISGDLPAYVMYTSGSTGQPKGVLVSHRNLLHSTAARLASYRAPPSVFLLLSSVSFDSSVAGIFWTLSTGGSLVVSEPRLEQDASRLSRRIGALGITHTLCVPSIYRLLLQHGDVDQLRSLTTVIVAGEPLRPDVLHRHRRALPETELYNEYGPTEATVWCSVFDTREYQGEASVPIGRPITGARLFLLDEEGRPVPVGVVGEIHVAGEGLAAGYLNRPDATAGRFVHREIAGEEIRLYRTGDLGRYGPGGNIEFVGRRDRQVKIRGFRVEPGEIEAVLERHEAIREAVVTPAFGAMKESVSPSALADLLRTLDPKLAEDILTEVEALTDEEARRIAGETT